MFPKQAIDALTILANAASRRESMHALARAREALGEHADQCEALLTSLAKRSEEIGHLRHMVGSDGLTGVANRRAFDEALVREVARHKRTHEPFAVILLDLDDLKQRNDTHGHAAGDAALVAMARACERVVRSTDVVARIGGDEFAALLPGSTQAGASILAGRLRDAVELVDVQPSPLRVSLGVAAAEHGCMCADAILGAADADLYRDKLRRKRTAQWCTA